MHILSFISKFWERFSSSDGLVLLLTLVTLWGIRKAPKGKFFLNPLNREQGMMLRGVFATVVVLLHIASRHMNMTDENLGFIIARFVRWGDSAVPVFFGLSGYGLVSQLTNRTGYLDGFIKRRFWALWRPYFIMLFLSLFQWIRGDYELNIRLIQQIGVVEYGWYIPVLMLFYVLFWWGYRAGRGCPNNGLILTSVGVLIATAILTMPCFGNHLSLSNGAFIVGLVLGTRSKSGYGLLCRYWKTIVVLICILLWVYGSWSLYKCCFLSGRQTARFIFNMFWVVGVVALSMKWQLGNRVLGWLGMISYELYLVHGWVMNEIGHWWPSWTGGGYAWTVVVISLVLAWVLHEGVEWWKCQRGQKCIP